MSPAAVPLLAVLTLLVAPSMEQNPTPARVASPAAVARGADFLHTECALDDRAVGVALRDYGEILANKTITPRKYVLGCLATHDEWRTGIHYITEAEHDMIPPEMADCCFASSVPLASVIYDDEFAQAVQPWYDRWKIVNN